MQPSATESQPSKLCAPFDAKSFKSKRKRNYDYVYDFPHLYQQEQFTSSSHCPWRIVIGTADAIIYHWFVSSVLGGYPLISVFQYIASGALGESAFAGGIATALLGVLFHFLISIVIAGVFILSADRIPLLRRYAIVGSLLYGFGVFIVMNMIVTPLSATPPLPSPTTAQLIVNIMDHVLVVGLPLGILISRNANFKQ